jgi:trans-2-enoyl-CoA reductase
MNRPNVEVQLQLLTNLGGDVNILDAYLGTAACSEVLRDLPPIKLALNCIGGNSATDLARALAPGGTLVTYGGMSKEPLTLPHDLLVQKQLKLRGFWIANWYASHSHEEASKMINDIAGMIRNKRLFSFFRMHDIDDFNHALQKATEPFQTRKVVLDLQPPDRFAEHDARPEEDYDVFDGPSYYGRS